jgi:predicted nucleic acid-binding Zn ribbon protein
VGLDETDAWQSAGELYICTACGEIYDIIAGNIYDDMEHCPTCNAELND